MRFLWFFRLLVATTLVAAAGLAQGAPTPEKVQSLLQILAEPDVQQ